MTKRKYPGRLTLEQWRALPREKRRELATRAQCDLLGSFRHCTEKICRRARTCSGDPYACHQKLLRAVKKMPKTLLMAHSGIAELARA